MCVGCWMLLSVIQWLMHTVPHLKLIFYSPLPTTDCNNHKDGSSWFLLFLFTPSPVFFFSPDPAPFIISDATKKWKKKNSRSHFINCCCVPKHISSLKHLDISVIEHFSPLLVKYASQSCLCVCARGGYKVGVCICACAAAWYLFCVCVSTCVCDVQSNKLKQHGDWGIDGSMNWYTVLVMSSVRRCMSLFYGLHL